MLRGEPAWDGIAEVWFDDIESMRANAGNPVLADIRADEANFISAGSMVSLITEEHTFVDGSSDGRFHMVLGFVKRNTGLTAGKFQEEWQPEGGPNAPRSCGASGSRPTCWQTAVPRPAASASCLGIGASRTSTLAVAAFTDPVAQVRPRRRELDRL